MFTLRKTPNPNTAPSNGAGRTFSAQLQRLKSAPFILSLIIFAPSPVLIVLSFLQMPHIQGGGHTPYYIPLLAIDVLYIVAICSIIVIRLIRISKARQTQRLGARLQMRLAQVFFSIALVPTVLAALFALLTINIGLEGWFSENVRKAIGTSLTAAEAYQNEQQQALIDDATKLAVRVNINKQRRVFIPAGDLRNILESEQKAIQRGLKEAYIIDGTGEIRARGERSYLFDYEKPDNNVMRKAQSEGAQLIKDWENGELRVLLRLDAFIDRYLYVSRAVDKKILVLLDDTQETIHLYQGLEQNRHRVFFEFIFLYFFAAANLVIMTTWFGLWIAESVSRRVGRIAQTAREVGKGNFNVRVDERKDLDEISTLGIIFDQMTEELSEQRKGLLKINNESEKGRRLFDSVLSNISAGVIGLNAKGNVEFINQAAEESLGLKAHSVIGQHLRDIAPEFMSLLGALKENPNHIAEEQIRFAHHRYIDDFFVRGRARKNQRGVIEGYVLALDNVTELVLAQRMAAWGDVARRIAHEIKNPLTPIRLAAERIRNHLEKDDKKPTQTLVEMTNVVTRQTNDIARIVNEFSKFARMPKPTLKEGNITTILTDTIALQKTAWEWIDYKTELPQSEILLPFDENLISQAFSNLLKNAGEAIQAKRDQKGAKPFSAEIHVKLELDAKNLTVRIADNGIGLPADRAVLFEPYVSHRSEGTGLGLSIVRKIVEEHGGTILVKDAEVFYEGDTPGALVEIILPMSILSEN